MAESAGPIDGRFQRLRRAAGALAACVVAAALLALAPAARAAPLEGVLSPGPVIAGHEKNESDCTSCHVPFDKNGQDAKCMDCHKEVARDVRAKTGFHGRIRRDACRTCHTDHKGRDARVIVLDETRFDHSKTDFTLRAAHEKVECAKCHVKGKTWRAAATDCNGCHRKDDVHKGQLGTRCADCHSEKSWKDTTFDHDRTKFPLRDKHANVKCRDCHQDPSYKNAPTTCVGCHRKDDKHKAHFGEKCDTCHNVRAWREITFNHDRDTKYPLRGRHATTRCVDCHAGDLYRDKVSAECIACHRKDDKHRGSEGEKCGSCHTERNWKEAKFDHSKTRFPLHGKHERIECNACHKSAVFTEAPRDCNGCHQKDDKHKGQFGPKCQACHDEANWKNILFNHDRDTKYPLRGKHATTRCIDCHAGNLYVDHLQTACIACHRKDDKHKGQEGERCEQCHVESDWKTTRRKFDHALSRFPLLGRHVDVACEKCHLTSQFKDAKTACVACHEKDDKHKRRLGTLCEDCHNARDWKAWDFNHDTRTKFKLDGGHQGIDCAACHRRPVDGRATLPMDCAACHGADDIHDGSFGKQCERCHVTTKFRTIKDRVGALARPQVLAAHLYGRPHAGRPAPLDANPSTIDSDRLPHEPVDPPATDEATDAQAHRS
ncbi:MAG TPA: cytochrome c3 family protein [Burkholderiaceae bacterium]|nr:cytochrome c3 family protein [Burkholderiaceae bacterium]